MAQNAASDGMSERQLALWMLEKMKDSEEFLGVLGSARAEGLPHFLDTPDIRALHTDRLRRRRRSRFRSRSLGRLQLWSSVICCRGRRS